MAAPKLSRRLKFTILAVFVGVGVLGFFIGNPIERFRANEQQACYNKCKALNKFSRLVPTFPPGSVGMGKYDGPWACECY
jgi:hypothetical protein